MPYYSSRLSAAKTYLHMQKAADEEKEPFIYSDDIASEGNHSRNSSNVFSSILDFAQRPILLWLIIIFLLICNTAMYISYGSFSGVPWSRTDFGPSRNAISRKLVKFSSGLDFVDTEKNIYRIYNPDEPIYVGNSTDVDRNWDGLIMPDYNEIKITTKETKLIDGDIYMFPDGTYTIA
ncbi:hypothetical protein B0O99DRAFT_686266 [Bisporella sp. PMI_857]|nr:hypothetical protein B0O99DRAFT_686266 [Bisporella sp. PMI_857]